MIKSTTHKIGPSEKSAELTAAIGNSEQKHQQSTRSGKVAYDSNSDSDSIVKDYDDNGEEDERGDSAEGRIDEIVVVPSSKRDKSGFEEDQRDHLSRSDTASSNESGFGTVDDEAENESGGKRAIGNEESGSSEANDKYPSAVITYQPLQQRLREDSAKEVSCSSSSSSESQQSDSISKYPQAIKLPTLQVSPHFVRVFGRCFCLLTEHAILTKGPRQIIYELNSKSKKNSDDNANILHDSSSVNSSSSSDDTGSHLSSCCCAHTLMSRLSKCYYNCLCCYPTWLSIFCCCCPVLGCISLYLTNRSKKLKLNQKYALAEKYSSYAEKLNIASLIFGVILYAIGVFLITLVVFMHWRHENRS